MRDRGRQVIGDKKEVYFQSYSFYPWFSQQIELLTDCLKEKHPKMVNQLTFHHHQKEQINIYLIKYYYLNRYNSHIFVNCLLYVCIFEIFKADNKSKRSLQYLFLPNNWISKAFISVFRGWNTLETGLFQKRDGVRYQT